MPSYKLTYFDIRGRGEIIRMVFEAAGVKFEDVRVSHDDWPTVKQTIPSGKVPVLEIDGKQFPQSHSIARYLARQYGLAGKSDMEQLYADIIADTCEDLLQAMAKFHFEKDEEKKKELFKQFGEKLLPPMIEQMNKAAEDWGKSGYLVGNDLTWADLRFYDFMETVLQMFPESLKKYPALVSNREKVAEHPKIKKYLQNRPKTQV